jgi:hypothetical protein
VNVNRVLRHIEAQFVGFAYRDPRFEASSGKPHREGFVVMVASQSVAPVRFALRHRRAPD